jgi:hypothetical protein
MDPNYLHEYNPRRKDGACKTIVAGRICGMPGDFEPHIRAATADKTLPFEGFEVESGESYDRVVIVFGDVFDTTRTLNFVEDAIREKMERL